MLELDPTLLPAFTLFLGEVGGPLMRKLAEKQIERYFGKALDKLEAAGKKDAVQAALETSSALWLEATLKNLEGLGYDAQDLAGYKDSFERFLEDDEVADELSKPVRDGDAWKGATPVVFQDAWRRLGLQPLPEGFQWPAALNAYKRLVDKQRTRQPELREVLNSEVLAAIRDELNRQGGVRPQGDEQRYRESMKQRYRIVDLSILTPPSEEGSPLLLRDVFVPQDARENPPPVEVPRDLLRKIFQEEKEEGGEAGELSMEAAQQAMERLRTSYTQQPRVPVLELLGRPDSNRLVLLGDPGSGKSTLTRYLLLSLLDPPADPSTGNPVAWVAPFQGALPLLIEIREFIARRVEGACQTFLEFFDHMARTQGYFVNEHWLDEQLSARPSLVLFDGLDEIFEPKLRERVMHEIAGFAASYPRARILVTSRPVGYKDAILKAAGFRPHALQDLDDGQIEAFVRGWFRQVFPDRPQEADLRIERILKATRQFRPIRLLAGNPMLLTIMALLARQQELPRERSRFYDYSAEILCEHWDVNRHLRDAGLDTDYIGLDDKKELLRRIAFRMQGGASGLAGNFLHEDELQAEFEGYLRERYRLEPKEAKSQALALIRNLRERNYILCLYGAGVYGFVHRTFLEYFCASEFVRRLEKDPKYSIERLIEEAYAPHWKDDAWREVLRLICGMVGEAYAGRIIEYLTDSANPGWRDRLEKDDPPLQLVLAVQCLAEVRNAYAIESVCLALLRAIVETLRTAKISFTFYGFARDRILSAMREIGPTWPGKEFLLHNLRQDLRCDADRKLVFPHPDLVTLLFAGDNRLPRKLVALTSDSVTSVRSNALLVLAQAAPLDSDVLQLLQLRAQEDEAYEVRESAVSALAQAPPTNPEVIKFLQLRAQRDEAYQVRRLALSALAQVAPTNPDVLQFIQGRAQQDESYEVRGSALSALARAAPTDPDVLKFLQLRAQQDEVSAVRTSALSTLARVVPTDPDVLRLLQTRVQQDEALAVRTSALSALAQAAPTNPELLQLLQNTLQNQEPELRRTALWELVRLKLDRTASCLISRDLDQLPPFLDPWDPLPAGHVERAAKKLGIDSDELMARIREYSQILDWDLFKGVGYQAEEPQT